MPNEPHRVGESVDPTVGSGGPTGSGIKGSKKRILDEYPGTGEAVELGGLTGVRITHDRH